MLGHFEEIDEAQETGLSSQLRRNVGKTDGLDGVDFDLAFFHAVTRAGFDVRAGPEADTASDLAAADALAEALGELHEQRLHRLGIYFTETGKEF